MTFLNEIIIVGGGKSILEGINLGLENIIKNKCTLLINYAYKHFEGTFLTYIDSNFYLSTHLDKNPDIWEELGHLPLIVGCKINPLPTKLHPNTIIIPCPEKELSSPPLTGLFALAIAIKLEPEKIFLLGFDWSRNPDYNPKKRDNYGYSKVDIHYYKKEIQHRGSSYTGFYNNHNPDFYFKHLNKSKSVIYNVSPESNITLFKKIDYTKMYSLLSNQSFNQEDLRKEIKKSL